MRKNATIKATIVSRDNAYGNVLRVKRIRKVLRLARRCAGLFGSRLVSGKKRKLGDTLYLGHE